MYQSHSSPDPFLSTPWSFQSPSLHLHEIDANNHHLHQLHRPPSSPLLNPSFLQRSNSAISLQKHVLAHQHHSQGNGGIHSESPDFYFPPIRRVSSTGDIRAANNCAVEIFGGGRVGRYNAEERRERIERYRSKRNQRNFQKKITYVCRKTLADSRPRIRGRFARNDEAMDQELGELSSSHGGMEEDGYDPAFWANFLDNLSAGNIIS